MSEAICNRCLHSGEHAPWCAAKTRIEALGQQLATVSEQLLEARRLLLTRVEAARLDEANERIRLLEKALREIKNFATEEWIISCARRALKDAG